MTKISVKVMLKTFNFLHSETKKIYSLNMYSCSIKHGTGQIISFSEMILPGLQIDLS